MLTTYAIELLQCVVFMSEQSHNVSPPPPPITEVCSGFGVQNTDSIFRITDDVTANSECQFHCQCRGAKIQQLGLVLALASPALSNCFCLMATQGTGDCLTTVAEMHAHPLADQACCPGAQREKMKFVSNTICITITSSSLFHDHSCATIHHRHACCYGLATLHKSHPLYQQGSTFRVDFGRELWLPLHLVPQTQHFTSTVPLAIRKLSDWPIVSTK